MLAIVGFCCVEVYPFGPVHAQVVASVAVPVKVKGLPTHKEFVDAETVTAVGTGQTTQLQFVPTPPIVFHLIPLYIYQQESLGDKVINPNAGDAILAVSTRVIKNPLFVEFKSNKAELFGATPVELIPTLWACVLIINTISVKHVSNNFFIVLDVV